MKLKQRLIHYSIIYCLFLVLYILTFNGNLNYTNLKTCLLSSILPGIVGGTAITLLLKKHVRVK